MRQNKSYETYTLMPGRHLPGIFLLSPGSLDHRLLRISKNVAKFGVEFAENTKYSFANSSSWRYEC